MNIAPTVPVELSPQLAVVFFCAVLLLDVLHISLPRGDSVGVSGAICAVAAVLMDSVPAVVLSLVPLSVVELVRHRTDLGRAVAPMLIRLASIIAAIVFGKSAYDYLGGIWAQVVVAPTAFLLAELFLTQVAAVLRSPRSLGRQLKGNLGRQGSLLAAQLSAAVLVVITYSEMGSWSLIPVTALLLLIRQSYALLLDVRESYRTTVEVLVEVAESQDARMKGHAERSAEIARAIAMRIGLPAAQVEEISYAALLHDIDVIAARAAPGGKSKPEATDHPGRTAAALLEDIDFFSGVIPILRLLEGEPCGFVPNQSEALSALVVALATDADAASVPAVADAHSGSSVQAVSGLVGLPSKASAVAAAVGLGYMIPAVK